MVGLLRFPKAASTYGVVGIAVPPTLLDLRRAICWGHPLSTVLLSHRWGYVQYVNRHVGIKEEVVLYRLFSASKGLLQEIAGGNSLAAYGRLGVPKQTGRCRCE